MDPASSPLGKMLLEEITPVVMVLSTPLVEEACLKNGVSFIEMLSPFCNFSNIDVPVRTSSDQPYRIHQFRLRLFYESDIRQPNLEVAKERLKQVISLAGENDQSDLYSDPPPIADVLASSESEILPSWFEIFNKELVRTVSFSDHEAFDHPVACLLVVSSKDEHPVNRFVDLFNTDKLPPLLNDGAMDPKILKHYLLVHDNQDGSSEKATKLLMEMKNTFGSNDCHVLCINSSEDGQMEHEENLWAPYKSVPIPDQRLGCFLNLDDCNEIKDLMQELSSKHIIPYMEQKVRVLNQQVSATRKGFRNQIKNLWWRKGKEDTQDSPDGPMYTFSSIESLIRVLGDYAFMLRDYELAMSNYRLISTDYKLDKAWKRYAGVQEMMGLTFFMLDQSRKEAEYCMENAFNTYSKLGLSGQQNATRCGLWWIEMLKTRDQYKEAATVYFRICSEELLYSAVMLEQASYCYFLSQPPMLHKYGFHLVLSGDRYRKCDEIKHAIRTFRRAISVYKGTKWSYIRDHVYFHIGQWYAFLGMYDTAVTHMLEVLTCSHQSKATQELFLREFLQIIQKTGKSFDVLRLQLPVIKISSLKVLFEDRRTYASPTVASVRESLWSSLEEDMIPSLSTGRTNWLELQSKLLPKRYKESNICVAGEAIKVDVEFENPLKIPISISGVSLICEHFEADEMKSDVSSSATELSKEKEHKNLGEMSLDTSLYTLSEINFTLGGNETTLVQLRVTPKVEGSLKIAGIRWKLSGSIVGYYNLESNLARRKIANRRKTKRTPSSDLEFIVIKSLPKLEGFIRCLPEKAYTGDLRHLVLELKNQSEFPVKNLKMNISHPRFLNIGKHEDLDLEFPDCLEKKNNSARNDRPADSKKVSRGPFLFPEHITIEKEKPLLWPLWLRAAAPGNISLYIVVYYEVGDASSVMKYRTLRMHYNLQVLPSLDVSFTISPCPSRLLEFLVRMDVVNKTISESFQVNQLSSVGLWEISLLQPADTIFPSSLIAGQALSFFFMLKTQRKSLKAGEKQSVLFPGSDVRLAPGGSKDALFDISSSPLADFHDSERLHQEMSNQEATNAADFILISRPLKSDTNPGNSTPPHIFSHHACHCSTGSTSPISWIMEGPRMRHHNFSASFCELNLKMTIYNTSEAVLSVVVNTIDSTSGNDEVTHANAVISGNETGWHSMPTVTDIKVTSESPRANVEKSPPPERVFPFFWSGTSSTRVQLGPLSQTEIPLQISVFSPGTFDLSNYVLTWNLLPVNGEGNVGEQTTQTSGTCPGYPFYLTVLQSD